MFPNQDIHHLPRLVDGAVEIRPLAGDLHVRLVGIPAAAQRPRLTPELGGQQRSEGVYPAHDGTWRHVHTAFREQVTDVSER